MNLSTTVQELTSQFAKHQLILDPVELITYEVDAGFDRGRPDGVFYPANAEEVSRIMRWATTTKTPLVARGAGTGLSGGAVAEHGGIIIEFARMNRLLHLDPVSRTGTVEPGLVNLVLDGEVRKHGLYYPPDPASQRSSVLGGNIGENSGGPHCFKYGVTTNYVTGLEVVLANGQIVQFGGPALDYPEYDFCGAMVGSEGTLGIFTKAHVRFIPNPPGVRTMMVAFPSLEAAGNAVSAVIAAGLTPATLEMMDQKIMGIIEEYSNAGLPVNAGAGLIVEVDGYVAGLDSQIEEIADLMTNNGGFDIRIAQSEAERTQIWYGRKSVAGAFARLSPNTYLVDVTVPRSRLADMLTAVDEVCERHNVQAGHVFHAGDGNLHPVIMCNARDEALMRRVFAACDEIIDLCVARKGSITGEHGVGIEKRRFMPAMYSGAELAAMLDLKAIFDPDQLLNPGKIFPDEIPEPIYAIPQLPDGEHFSPASVAEAASGLAAYSKQRQPIIIANDKNAVQPSPAVQVTTHNLRGVMEFAPADLYITVGAGMTIAELTPFLAEHHLQTAVVSPWPNATVGGLVATNLNSPQRSRYGALRDNLLSTNVALADGRIIQAGRGVVKNVAGYDLPKLFVGSHGKLGLMTDVTLKLYPLARRRYSIAIPIADMAAGISLATALMGELRINAGMVLIPTAQLQATSLEPSVRQSHTLILTAEGIIEDVEEEVAAIHRIVAQEATIKSTVMDKSAVQLWQETLMDWQEEELVVRIGVPTAKMAGYLSTIAQELALADRYLIDVLHGLLYIRYHPKADAEGQTWFATLRRTAQEIGGYAIALAVPLPLADEIEQGVGNDSVQELMQKLKQRWDPQQILQ